MVRKKIIPRGIRNNNPLNIRCGNVWLGETPIPNDPHFEQFIHMKYGLRAGFVIIRRYINHYKRRTIREIISSWAPSTENNTISYISAVSKQMGIASDIPLSYGDKSTMCDLVSAMCQVECGQPIDRKLIEQSYDMA